MSTNHNLSEDKGEPKRYRTKVTLLTSLTPYRWAKPAHTPFKVFDGLYACVYTGVSAFTKQGQVRVGLHLSVLNSRAMPLRVHGRGEIHVERLSSWQFQLVLTDLNGLYDDSDTCTAG